MKDTDVQYLQRLAGIITESKDAAQLWKEFSKVAEEMTTMLSQLEISSNKAPKTLNPLQINDIAYGVKQIQQQLDMLDQRYQWREHMKARRSKMQITPNA